MTTEEQLADILERLEFAEQQLAMLTDYLAERDGKGHIEVRTH